MTHDSYRITLQFMQLVDISPSIVFICHSIHLSKQPERNITRKMSLCQREWVKEFMCCSFFISAESPLSPATSTARAYFHPHKCFMTKILTPNKLHRWNVGRERKIYLREFYASPIIEVYNAVKKLESGVDVRDSDTIETPNVSKLAL